MERYSNRGRDSGVYSYEIGSTYIKVRYRTGKSYLYTYRSAGRRNIETMKQLAVRGSGLNSYINSNVKYNYAR